MDMDDQISEVETVDLPELTSEAELLVKNKALKGAIKRLQTRASELEHNSHYTKHSSHSVKHSSW